MKEPKLKTVYVCSNCRSWGSGPSSGGLSLRSWSRRIRFSASVLSSWTPCFHFMKIIFSIIPHPARGRKKAGRLSGLHQTICKTHKAGGRTAERAETDCQ